MMKFILAILFSFYASLDVLVLSESQYSIRQHLWISLISSFFTAAGLQIGSCLLSCMTSYTPDEMVTIALLFLILYLMNFKTQKFMLTASFIQESQKMNHAGSTGVILGINNLGFGILAGIQSLSLIWMVVFSFLFGILLLNRKTDAVFKHKLFSLILLIIMIFCINKK